MSMSKLTIHCSPIPPIFTRGRQAFIVIQNNRGEYLLSHKHAYPIGIARLIGGGIAVGETPLQGAIRELHEEVGINAKRAELSLLHKLKTTIIGPQHTYIYTAYIYRFIPSVKDLDIHSELSAISAHNRSQLKVLINRYQRLSEDLVNPSGEWGSFRWSDYGKVFSHLHRMLLEDF